MLQDRSFPRQRSAPPDAELRLAAGTPQKHHQPARYRQRKIAAVIVLNQLQRKIDAGGDPGQV
jgi:hypothetical protein